MLNHAVYVGLLVQCQCDSGRRHMNSKLSVMLLPFLVVLKAFIASLCNQEFASINLFVTRRELSRVIQGNTSDAETYLRGAQYAR